MEWNAQLTRENDFSFTWIKIVYCLIKKTLKYNSLVQKSFFEKFPQKDTSHYKSSFALGPQEPKQYIFGDHIYSKNAGRLRFHVFFYFHVSKHMTSTFYMKWTEFVRKCELSSNCESLGTRTKLEQIHNFLWIWSTSGKIMTSYVF